MISTSKWQMVIDHPKVVVIFVTQRAILHGESQWGKGPVGNDDNCRFELKYALREKRCCFHAARRVMQPRLQGRISRWRGVIAGKLGGMLLYLWT